MNDQDRISAHNPKELICDGEAARFLNLSVATLRNWRFQKKGPAYVRLGYRSIRYRVADLEAFIASSRTEQA